MRLPVVLAILALGSVSLEDSSLVSSPMVGKSLSSPEVTGRRLHSLLCTAAVTFEANRGQFNSQVLFAAREGGAQIWFARDAVYLRFVRAGHNDSLEYLTVRRSFEGARRYPEITGCQPVTAQSHYFHGNAPAFWRTNVPHFAAVFYHQIYPGIDLRYYFNGRGIEYDLILSPLARLDRFKVRFEGIDSLYLGADGTLIAATEWGTLTESEPLVYQMVGGKQVVLRSTFVLFDSITVGFSIVDRAYPDLATVIDPLLGYGTFLGGNSYDHIADVAVDSAGSVVVTGHTFSLNFPVSDALQGSIAGDYDLFISKYDPNGDSLVFSTYIGGGGYDEGTGIALDGFGNCYVAGGTSSTDFPTARAIQPQLAGGTDAFAALLTATGDSLLYSTYLGGSANDKAFDIALDRARNIYLTGSTVSHDFPLRHAFQDTLAGILQDAFVCRISAGFRELLYSTYFGGNGVDLANGIAVGVDGRAAIVGTTNSSAFPLAAPLLDSLSGGDDAFVSLLDSGGTALVFSTYFGGGGDDKGRGIAIAGNGDFCLVGTTYSLDSPVCRALQDSCASCPAHPDAFVARLTRSGNCVFSTYLGGSLAADEGLAVAVDEADDIFIAGLTTSDYFPVVDPLQSFRSDLADAFISELKGDGSELLFSTFWGGSSDDEARAMAINKKGNLAVAGRTKSSDFPLLQPQQQHFGGGMWDGFVLRLDFDPLLPGCGDFDASDDVNVTDLVYLISYIFTDGPPPQDRYQGDVDCDGMVSLTDAVYMVRYIFVDGPAPCFLCP